MKWNNVKWVFLREARDQLRDRRTLFTIAILPLLLYPLMGMVTMQISQFMREHPTKVRLIGARNLPTDPPLLDDGSFHSDIMLERERSLLELQLDDFPPPNVTNEQFEKLVERDIHAGRYDTAIYFPNGFAEDLAAFRSQLAANGGSDPSAAGKDGEPTVPLPPSPSIFFNAASDKSRVARDRVERVLQRWRESIVRENLRSRHVPESATQPFELKTTDVAEEFRRRAAFWSKVMPFVVLIWALTGAFYPAIDLCAGEKERGTLETLLCSPAERSEIVWGKLLTVMAFSMATSLLNMCSLGATALLFLNQYAGAVGESGAQFAPPPPASILWLILALIPTTALFSALALAIAAFARSSKEGQYYLMPLLLVTLPLMLLPMLPQTQLTWGTSLIPVSGLMMLLRLLIEGQYRDALLYLLPVAGVTTLCCLLAIRWAIDQFSNESVLFRESERFGLGVWLRHLMRVRGATPTAAQALLCGLVLLLIRFFGNFFASMPQNWPQLVFSVLVTQLAFIATPALLMTLFLTRSPRKTLLLTPSRPASVVVAGLLALAVHPVALVIQQYVGRSYQLNDDIMRQLEPLAQMIQNAPLLSAILVMALIPACCEELAFRGFVLSGLRHTGHKWVAIAITAVLFGWLHPVLPQQINAALIGLLIGYLAVQTGSLLPAVVFHFTHNALAISVSRLTPEIVDQWPVLSWIYEFSETDMRPHWSLVAVGGLVALLLCGWLHRLPYQPTAEEKLRSVLDHQTSTPVGGGVEA
jgi:sodium transport system permease protein